MSDITAEHVSQSHSTSIVLLEIFDIDTGVKLLEGNVRTYKTRVVTEKHRKHRQI